MAVLSHKIDFALVFTVRNANPNGDPLDGNRPRTTYDGRGEVSDVCLKRKIRNRLLDEGEPIFVQSDDRRVDEYRSLMDRAKGNAELKKYLWGKQKDKQLAEKIGCESWYDVRAFGQVFPFGSDKKADEGKKDGEETEKKGKNDSVSVGVRGPVSIQPAFSVDPVVVTSTQITKSVNLKVEKDPDGMGSDRMGMKHRVDSGVYVTCGSINVQCAQRTGFTEEDADKLKEALRTLFRNDATSARPDGSMEVVKLIWWKHNCASGQYSSARVHRSLHVAPDGKVTVDELDGLACEKIDGE